MVGHELPGEAYFFGVDGSHWDMVAGHTHRNGKMYFARRLRKYWPGTVFARSPSAELPPAPQAFIPRESSAGPSRIRSKSLAPPPVDPTFCGIVEQIQCAARAACIAVQSALHVTAQHGGMEHRTASSQNRRAASLPSPPLTSVAVMLSATGPSTVTASPAGCAGGAGGTSCSRIP